LEQEKEPYRRENATFSWTNFDLDLATFKKLGVTYYRLGLE
jgi:beta-glucosidase/6-phospho-beta-glucosidase/beta-galactosidase